MTNACDHLSRALRTALPAALVLCIAALLGLTPIAATAADPTSADPTSADRAPHESAAAENPSATQEISARQRDASARHGASARDLASKRSSRGMTQSRGRQEPLGRPLDLSAPPISHVMTREQVQTLLASEQPEVPEDVTVEGGRYQAPVPQGQIRAIAWALVHPLQAWRIFTPITDQ